MAKNESLEEVIRRDIIAGALAPATRLRMEDLRLRFDAGFSPIREALSRLVGEGLVEFEANRGFSVSALSQGDLRDIAIARRAVEVEALRLSIENGDDAWEAGLVSAMHLYRKRAANAFDSDATLKAWEEAHDDLHFALIGACKSRRLIGMQRRLQDQHVRYRRLIVLPQVSGEAHVEEHEKLVAFALERDVENATAEMARHLMITVDALSDNRFWQEDLTAAG